MHALEEQTADFDQWLKIGRKAALDRAQSVWAGGTLDIELNTPVEDLFDATQDFGWLLSTPDGVTRLGLGSARLWQWRSQSPWPKLQRLTQVLYAQGLTDTWLVGGHGFSPQHNWPAIPYAVFAVPALQIEQQGRTTRLRLAWLVHPDDTWDELAAQSQRFRQLLRGPVAPTLPPRGQPAVRWLSPKALWIDQVQKAVHTIREGSLQKVVLARSVVLSYPDRYPTSRILSRLRAQNPSSAVFAVRLGTATFLGATPELLGQFVGEQFSTMCLAGSAPRGQTPAEDRTLAQALLAHPKNLQEHQAVRRYIQTALKGWVADMTYPDHPQIKQLPTVQHLWTPVHARLCPNVSPWSVIARLHPTPAVAGVPVAAARQYIIDTEPIARGWYAGLVGFSDLTGHGEWWVGLRSGLFVNRDAVLYAGCGIMADSDPEQEWAESRWKFRTMLHALSLGEDYLDG